MRLNSHRKTIDGNIKYFRVKRISNWGDCSVSHFLERGHVSFLRKIIHYLSIKRNGLLPTKGKAGGVRAKDSSGGSSSWLNQSLPVGEHKNHRCLGLGGSCPSPKGLERPGTTKGRADRGQGGKTAAGQRSW